MDFQENPDGTFELNATFEKSNAAKNPDAAEGLLPVDPYNPETIV